MLFPGSCRCCKNVPSMRCLISVHISSVKGNNKSQLTSSINKMYYYPSTRNEREVCLAHATTMICQVSPLCCWLFLCRNQGSHNFIWHLASEHESFFWVILGTDLVQLMAKYEESREMKQTFSFQPLLLISAHHKLHTPSNLQFWIEVRVWLLGLEIPFTSLWHLHRLNKPLILLHASYLSD